MSPLAVHELGGDGPPLVLVHATGFHGRIWEPFARRLQGFRVVAPDLPGHGDSHVDPGDLVDDRHDLSWSHAATALLAAIDSLGLDKPFGVGHSMGGSVLLMAEQQRPGTFRSLYLYEPVAFPSHLGLGPDDNPLAAGALRRRATFPSRQAALDNYASKPPLDVLDPEVLRAYVEHGFAEAGDEVRLRCDPVVESQTYRMGLIHDTYDHLGEVSCPVVIARGRLEELSPALSAKHQVAKIPDGRLEVFESLGHFGPLERPDLLADAVSRAFASQLPG